MQVNPAFGSILSVPMGQKDVPARSGQLESGDVSQSAAKQLDSAVDGVGESSKSRSSEHGQGKKDGSSSEPDLQESLKKLNEAVQLYRKSNLQFTIDKDTSTTVVKVVDSETDQVIRQIPSEDALRIAKAIDDFKGLLLKDKA
nr:flagellar protein FlaG [uncultured Pseudogulbenkiania sp.]